MEDIPQRAVELVSRGRECAPSDCAVDQRRIGHVVGYVLGEPGVEQYLRVWRVLLPHQTHVHGFCALHRNERRDLATVRGITDGVADALGSSPHRAEAEGAQKPSEPCELRQALMP